MKKVLALLPLHQLCPRHQSPVRHLPTSRSIPSASASLALATPSCTCPSCPATPSTLESAAMRVGPVSQSWRGRDAVKSTSRWRCGKEASPSVRAVGSAGEKDWIAEGAAVAEPVIALDLHRVVTKWMTSCGERAQSVDIDNHCELLLRYCARRGIWTRNLTLGPCLRPLALWWVSPRPTLAAQTLAKRHPK